MTTTELIQVILMGLLVVITGIYAWRTFTISKGTERQAQASVEMAEEMKEQRYDAVRPVVDIQKQVGSGLDFAREEIAALKGELPQPQALPCKLRNIGPGPAIDVYSFIEYPIGAHSRWYFGTIATGDELVPPAPLAVIEQSDDRGFLVVYYKDVYDRSFKSSQEVKINKEGMGLDVAPLTICKLPKEEQNNND